MSFQIQLNLPSNGWDYIPLPSFRQHSSHYEVILKISFPSFTWLGMGQGLSVEPSLVQEARRLIEEGHLNLCEEGVGGTYFILDQDETPIAVFKPEDEEPGSPKNPKGLLNEPLLPPGGGASREVAAYLLDKGFSCIPETHYISNVNVGRKERKSGSVQRFVPNKGVSSEFGTSMYEVENVHHIALFDICTCNLDRNGENLLVTKQASSDKYRLIPIDHSYCFPPLHFIGRAFFEWQHWPQAKKPFSPETLAHIQSLDVEEDAEILRNLGISEDCVETMVVCTVLLKKAAEVHMTLYDIAMLMTRKKDHIPSQLEQLVSLSEKISISTGTEFIQEIQKSISTLFMERRK
eukprot:TRINITY_DN11908_c0_g1_i1.p1 TRINITY_DN11908_c0_g1~~TRINITY_DN11908_c0_g1_i1.p1  ORF type:complete len:349 (+),score=55.41 TRINITY_DN11908_c0_g1_i1:108-1154(+)